ncbi:hypothetical protein [Microvirga antarctica]|uniref:hypothetical protein n=1 Tax=Microvirga antarctica TaxID=2819233 RepID=UPI001B30B1B4|nr:hypothetical protein [Microvirga antarctica]
MARLQPVSRELTIAVSADLAPAAQAKLIADAARQGLKEAQADNQSALGHVPAHSTFVNGSSSEALESVNPDRGSIAFVFDVQNPVVDWVWDQVVRHSPVLTGRYQRAHLLFADGVEMAEPDPVKTADEWVVMAGVPYARKIERGLSKQAPEGVYEAVSVLAAQRFGNLAQIRFSYRTAVASTAEVAKERKAADRAGRQPAIIIRMR